MIISNMMRMKVSQLCVFTTLSFLAAMLLIPSVLAEQCGKKAEGALCLSGYCCRGDYCDPPNCQSQSPSPPPPFTPPPLPPPPPPVPSPDITEIITSELFDLMLLHRNDAICQARGFYTYDAFVQAARNFTGFATTGDNIDDRKREVAAFFAHTSHMTTEGWTDAPNGTYAWGYCINTDQGSVPPENRTFDCIQSAEWPCAPGKKYYGRGPMLITYNLNYGPCGVAIGEDLLGNPDLVETDTVISFKSALWYWMTPVPPTKPSPHDVMVGNWVPSQNDIDANRLPGFGVTTNIFNGGLECGKGPDERATNRIGFYERFCGILGVSPGENTGCEDQKPFGPTSLLFNSM